MALALIICFPGLSHQRPCRVLKPPILEPLHQVYLTCTFTMSALIRNSVADINISFIGLHMNFILKAAFLADVYIENLNFLF